MSCLQSLHAAGKIRLPQNRAGKNVHTDFPTVGVLLQHEAIVINSNIYYVAMLSMGWEGSDVTWNFREAQQEHTKVKKMTSTVWFATAECKGETVAIHEKKKKTTSVGCMEGGGYLTKKLAKSALLWHMITGEANSSDSLRWIMKVIHEKDWKSICEQGDQMEATPEYVLLRFGEGPPSHYNILMKYRAEIWMRVLRPGKNENVLATFQLCDTSNVAIGNYPVWKYRHSGQTKFNDTTDSKPSRKRQYSDISL